MALFKTIVVNFDIYSVAFLVVLLAVNLCVAVVLSCGWLLNHMVRVSLIAF
jgi:hypothetical protein